MNVKTGRIDSRKILFRAFEYSESKVKFAALNFKTAMQVTAEVKKNLFKTFGGAEKNTGSTSAQIALFTERINHISGHLETNKKDHSTTLSLMKLVGRRRRLLNYLMKQDLLAYRALIEKLGIRK